MPNYFYEDEQKKERIKESLLTDRAQLWAKSFINPKQPKDKLTSTQIRKFHIEAKELEERVKNLENPDEDFKKIRPLVKMMKAKVAYACRTSAKEKKVPEEFRNYIEEMVDNIEDWKDFKAFALCFESVVGFFYGQGGR